MSKTTIRAVEQSEEAETWDRVADARWAKVLATGRTVQWDEAKAYVEAKARGEQPQPPTARDWLRARQSNLTE